MDSRMKGWVDSWIDGEMNREIDEGRLDGTLGVGMDVERWTVGWTLLASGSVCMCLQLTC